jgi:hypothetical protein
LRPVKKIGYILISTIIISLSIISCSEEEVAIEGLEPFVTVKFINIDSANKLTILISQIDASLKIINARIKEIDALEDRTPFLAEKDSLNLVKTEITNEKASLNSIKSDINNGLINLAILEGEGGETIIEGDSLKEHIFPLNANISAIRYFTTINNDIDTIDFNYNLKTLEIENQVRVEASALEVAFHSFDSVKLVCKDTSTCISNDATLIIYF